MTKKRTDSDASQQGAGELCERLADTVIDLFVDYLQQAVKENPNLKLDAQELAFQSRQFKKDEKERYLNRTQKIAEAWLNASSRDQNNESRKRAFERVLVKRFSHLFPPNESLKNDRAISRRIIPGLLSAFEQLAGAEFVQQCQAAGRNVLKNVRESQGKDFSWSAFYDDPAINDLVDDLMAVVAWSFQDVAQRTQWMLTLINLNLAPPEDYLFEGEGVDTWTFKQPGLIEMLRALFSDFRDKLANTDGRRAMEQRYGQKACRAIQGLIEKLDRANGY